MHQEISLSFRLTSKYNSGSFIMGWLCDPNTLNDNTQSFIINNHLGFKVILKKIEGIGERSC